LTMCSFASLLWTLIVIISSTTYLADVLSLNYYLALHLWRQVLDKILGKVDGVLRREQDVVS